MKLVHEALSRHIVLAVAIVLIVLLIVLPLLASLLMRG